MTWNKEKERPAPHSRLWFSATQVHFQRQRPKRGAALHFYLACRSPRSVTFCSPRPSPFSLSSLPAILWGFVHLSYFAVIVLMFLSARAWRASEQQVCPEPLSSGLFITTVSDVLFQAGEGACGGGGGGGVCRGRTCTLVWSQKRL